MKIKHTYAVSFTQSELQTARQALMVDIKNSEKAGFSTAAADALLNILDEAAKEMWYEALEHRLAHS